MGSTGGIASGPVGFIRAFDVATDVVKQGGTRRGANMAILRVDHPDILTFIHSKDAGDALENFNISVAITDAFMQAVEADAPYKLINPRSRETAGEIPARDVWNQIVDSAHRTGDPGLMFLDTVNRDNPNPHLGPIESTNPCVTGDTLVMTAHGPQRADSLTGRAHQLLVDGAIHATGPDGFFSTGVKPVITIRTRSGRSITLTQDHPIARTQQDPGSGRTQRAWTPAGDLMPGDTVSLHDHRPANRRDQDSGHQAKAKRDLTRLFSPDHLVINPRENNPSMHLRDLQPQQAQLTQALLAYLGIQTTIRVTAGSNEHELHLENQDLVTYIMKASRHQDTQRQYLRQLAGALLEGRPAVLQPTPVTDTIDSIEPAGEQEVFDVQVPGVNAFDANGLYVHNCGEQLLLPNESCNLGSINLANMVQYDPQGHGSVNQELLEQTCGTAVHMLDNVIDMNEFPSEDIDRVSKSTRRIGVGVMGFSDLLVQLGIPYDSQEARDMAESTMQTIQGHVHQASQDLALTRGAYPEWLPEEHPGENGQPTKPLRNTAPTTIAPTGTISIIAGASSGIEPLFALSYERHVMDNDRLVEANPYFEAAARAHGFYSKELMEHVASTGTVQQADVPQWVKDTFKTAMDISPQDHVLMQAAWQRHVDNAVSKTINFPNTATREQVEEAYITAYQNGCKGITVYRDGSKENQVLTTGTARAANGHQLPLLEPAPSTTRERPRTMEGRTERIRTGHGNMYVTINFEEELPFEMFCQVGRAGGCDSAHQEAISRLISLALRSNIDPMEIVDNLRGITCCPTWDTGELIKSIPDGLAQSLYRSLPESQRTNQETQEHTTPRPATAVMEMPAHLRRGPNLCPDCGGDLIYQEGCKRCVTPNCGWNLCE